MRKLYPYKHYLIALLTRTFHSAKTLEPLETVYSSKLSIRT